MNLILFVHTNPSEKAEILKNIIYDEFKKCNIQTIQTFNLLKNRLKKISYYEREIFIFVLDSKNRLEQLTSLLNMIGDRRIILILPDNSKATISKAHQFYPRFFTYINSTYDDLFAVLTKMIQQEKIKINP